MNVSVMRGWPELHNAVIFEDAGNLPRLFEYPEYVIETALEKDIASALRKADEASREGLYVAGFLSYDVGQGARGSIFPKPIPRLWLGCYSSFSRASFLEDSTSSHYSLKAIPPSMDERDSFMRSVEQIRESIRSGIVYQVNHTRRKLYDMKGSALALYARLRSLQRARYAAFVSIPDFTVLSLSPELFFSLEDDWIESHPMKGTFSNFISRNEIDADEKSLSENHMILDLVRNDIGRIAEPGSFSLDPARIVQLSTLQQMISVVRARLKKHTGLDQIFAALFPPGSVTGAPKRTAMQSIDQLEPARGVYTGAIGVVEPFRRSAVFNVAIRTLQIQHGHAVYGTGCGIVWDSVPSSEWAESELKTAWLKPALDDFHIIETMRMDQGRVFLLRAHLRRMQKSAEFFKMDFSVRDALQKISKEKQADRPLRIRLALYATGIEIKIAPAPPFRICGTSRVIISQDAIHSGDPFRIHKTSERSLYDELFRKANDLGFDDAIFLNETGEVAETAICNLMVKKGMVWVTPEPSAGALPGIMMRECMRRFPGRIVFGTILAEDLKGRVLVCNSVRGIMRARIFDSTK
ncbi:MAG TPA: bifunctional anthranilate synthase component I family protein/class IV aminotransferase [Leptospiraceae bacterium]|nr:bifunctional anthranilate synthase component I family protein/class IV aminotransferase [Leptospiraceae bacterium]